MDKNVREPSLLLAFLPLLVLIVAAIFDLLFWRTYFMPLIFTIIATAVTGMFLGFKWKSLEQFMINGAKDSISIVIIMFLIGTIIGSWMLSGTIPTLIYYGLATLSPSIFIPTVAITTGIMAIVIGSSLTSIATIGVALMAIGQSMGFPPELIAGAIISGAFLGDKLSPLSDTTIMTPAMTDTDLFSHIRHMMWDTIPAFLIALVLYWFVGLKFTPDTVNQAGIAELMSTLQANFNINLILLLLPLITIFIMVKRYPVIPSLLLLSLTGGLFALIFQGSSISEIILAMNSGYSGESGSESLDKLINRGGINSMFFTVALIMIATILGGILEGTGVFRKIIQGLINKARSTGSLVLTTALTTLGIAFASGSQALPIILSGKGFQKAYKERGLDTKNLSRTIEACGTVGVSIVPWGIVAIFVSTVLGGISPYDFIPYIFFAFIVPLVNIFYGYTGISIAKKNYPETIIPSNPNNKLNNNQNLDI
ncbi:Na+/H+ antiporter NhaC [Bacillus sp. DJP31]|uniref:Na+/H+ antiporter NhaC n=1 Tax=Bacillus sp. DJP31 TaxID=3409789 RepID=UPI003BB6D945